MARRAPPVRGAGPSPPDEFHHYEGSNEPPLPDARGPGHSSRRLVMPVRELPPHPNVRQLKHQAKDLLRAARAGEPAALAAFAEFHPEPIDPPSAKSPTHTSCWPETIRRQAGRSSWPSAASSRRSQPTTSRPCAGSLARTPRSCTIGTAASRRLASGRGRRGQPGAAPGRDDATGTRRTRRQ